MKNINAQALGRLGVGKPKTGLTHAERRRRSELARANLAGIVARRHAVWLARQAGENKHVG